jgi:hypothetical protein
MTDWSAILAHAFETAGQKCGDGGDSGDKRAKALRQVGNPPHALGTTCSGPVVTVVTPLEAVTTVTTAARGCGDKGKSEIPPITQGDRDPVTTVTTVTTDIHSPDACDRLRSMTPLDSFSAEAWHQLLLDVDSFFQHWAEQAELLAWSDKDLIGVHPRAPAARYDAMGLLFLIRGSDRASRSLRHDQISTWLAIGLPQVRTSRRRDAVGNWRALTHSQFFENIRKAHAIGRGSYRVELFG